MRAHVRKWGNSTAVRLPAAIMTASALKVNQAVEIKAEGGSIVIKPVVAPVYDLDELLDAMDPDTFPEDVDFGGPVGREIW